MSFNTSESIEEVSSKEYTLQPSKKDHTNFVFMNYSIDDYMICSLLLFCICSFINVSFKKKGIIPFLLTLNVFLFITFLSLFIARIFA